MKKKNVDEIVENEQVFWLYKKPEKELKDTIFVSKNNKTKKHKKK